MQRGYRMKPCILFFGAQVLVNILIVFQVRATALAIEHAMFIANVALAATTFLIVRCIVTRGGKAETIGYALGGGVGSVMGLHLMRAIGI